MKPFQPSVIEATDLTKVFERSIKLAQIPEKKAIELLYGENIPDVNVNPEELEDIISELLINAWNAVEQADKQEIKIYADIDKECVKVKISDTGNGISKENLDQIWSLGFTTKGLGGTGYGMYKCAQLLRKNGASIFVESEVGIGTTFTIRLPIANEDV